MQLTPEQQQVIAHPAGCHGKVLAVAGSGKTTTMAHRILHLIQQGAHPSQIQVLMFNRLARDQFVASLQRLGLGEGQQPPVNTFHSYAYRLFNTQGYRMWVGDTEDLDHLCLRKAKTSVERRMRLHDDVIDLDIARQAIDLWKGSLIPPSRAGFRGARAEAYVALYDEYETLRQQDNAITYADFVPLAVLALEGSSHLLREKAGSVRFLIVDEYQDVNLGQQRLVELLASEGADLMVVGDDDQTIYEWRGARSDYILGEFEATFTNKPHHAYRLTRSFRFGYCIAQTGYNVIQHNARRLEKHLISNKPGSASEVTLITDEEEQGGYAHRRMAEEIIRLVKENRVPPSDIRVLARTYAQLASLQTELLLKRIPFKVDGRAPFLQTGESQALLNYVRVAAGMDQAVSEAIVSHFLSIGNKPSRYLARRDLEAMLRDGRYQGLSLSETLDAAIGDPARFARGTARANLMDLASVLDEIRGRLVAKALAGPLLAWINDEVGLQRHYEEYYGPGEASLIRVETVRKFIEYAHATEMRWPQFLDHVDNADTTWGQPDAQCLTMMTIHRAKGLEFDYVFIPDCQEGFLPVMGSSEDPTFDTRAPDRAPKAAEWIENERRLFYVGATRARKELFIGAPAIASGRPVRSAPKRNQPRAASRFLEEMELSQTREVAYEMRRAARGQGSNRLVEVCQRWSRFHHIIGRVKEEYARMLPKKLRPLLAQVELSDAARPFRYQQEYDSPLPREQSTSRSRMERDAKPGRAAWDHIDTRWPRRRSTQSRTRRRVAASARETDEIPF